ncbi:hypothetical protein MJO29_004717 [Puccinia striiformis f. sp. tritici]|uniref:hypothetical protein n=1 Tax=Puccinia striiformis f. sp. tritici TaxID=168172 RepID=UPI002007A0EF|nr:hypothetical protein Pst134EA_007780 [Puccinia striiformis f. sp. tritici]KAH9470529.1 hypothetical protein Pst134EA_007780 [Puccinia striiformis f. sp. tritici]KAI7964290.1 hypothetical protein MJO29_004717 [Puccinia striiformis f. sp. tritici]KAI9625160.1 hypothetical protein KEM48_008560 [Puccinia striiformis f. sp. tritici PST-130]
MFARLLIAISLISLSVQGVASDGDSLSSANELSPRQLLGLDLNLHTAIALKSEFSDIHNEIREAREPLERACKANDLDSVLATVVGFQKSFRVLANSCSRTYNRHRGSPSKLADGLITILVEFQPLLKTLQAHPSLLEGCSHTFRSSSTSINAMISFLKAGKADLKSEVQKAGGGLDLNLYAQCGFKINPLY